MVLSGELRLRKTRARSTLRGPTDGPTWNSPVAAQYHGGDVVRKNVGIEGIAAAVWLLRCELYSTCRSI